MTLAEILAGIVQKKYAVEAALALGKVPDGLSSSWGFASLVISYKWKCAVFIYF